MKINIYPKYSEENLKISINLDLIYCKGGLIEDDYVISQYNDEKCYKLTNEFGYSYVGKFENCYSKKCKNIKETINNLIDEKRKKFKRFNTDEFKLDIYEYFEKVIKIDILNVSESVKEFIDKLKIYKEKYLLNRNVNSKLNLILFHLQYNIKEGDFINLQRGGYKRNKSIKKKCKKYIYDWK